MTEKVVWRDRVKEFRRVPASELRANPKNWREHPAEQRRALNGILEEVGIAGAVLARETEDGLELIDGHLRAEMDPASVWPVLVLDVNEAEADALLASIDPIGAMATRNDEALSELLDGMDIQSKDLNALLTSMASELDPFNEGVDDKYTQKVEIPVYEMTGEKPEVEDLFDSTETNRLLDKINTSTEPGPLREFLSVAAHRHTKFRYDLIAEFYAHSDASAQSMIEESALVILDVDRAIELGFLKMTEELQRLTGLSNGE